MSESSQPALVLDDPAVAHGEPVHFANFPGRFVAGEPVAISELDFADADEALDRVAELGLPLAETTVAHGEGLLPPDPSRMPSLDEARALEDWKPEPGQPGAELAPGEVFPAAPPVADAELAERVAPALEPNAAEVIDAVALVDDVSTLEAMRDAETGTKDRKTVLAAIDARLAELAPDEEEAGS